MKSHWMLAAVLTAAVAAGCNGRNDENAQNTGQPAPAGVPAGTEQTLAPVAQPPLEQPSTAADSSAVRANREPAAVKPTTGRREAATQPTRRAETAPQGTNNYNSSAANTSNEVIQAMVLNSSRMISASRFAVYCLSNITVCGWLSSAA